MTDVVDAQVVDEPGTDLEPVAAPTAGQVNLFHTDDPSEFIERASKAADALKGVLDRQGLTQNIQGRSYVKVEGWTTLGSMLGVAPVCVWTREIPNGWEARVEARTLGGQLAGAAEAQCTRDERTWKSRDAYALRSMAQTRATSKALRVALGFVVTMAGYDATPSEEVPDSGPAATPAATAAEPMNLAQYTEIATLYQQAGAPAQEFGDYLSCEPTQDAIADAIRVFTSDQATGAIRFLKGLAA
jgi:hypothetical protein